MIPYETALTGKIFSAVAAIVAAISFELSE